MWLTALAVGGFFLLITVCLVAGFVGLASIPSWTAILVAPVALLSWGATLLAFWLAALAYQDRRLRRW